MGLRWCMITLFDRLKPDYRLRIEAIRKEFPCIFQFIYQELEQKDFVGKLSMKAVSDLILCKVIQDYKEAYDMFCTKEQYEAEWAEYVEDKMRYEAQIEMEGEDNE